MDHSFCTPQNLDMRGARSMQTQKKEELPMLKLSVVSDDGRLPPLGYSFTRQRTANTGLSVREYTSELMWSTPTLAYKIPAYAILQQLTIQISRSPDIRDIL